MYNSLVGVNVTVERTHEGGRGYSIVAMNYNEPSHCVNDSSRYSSRRCCCSCTAYASRPIKGSSPRWKKEFEPRREVNNHGRSRGGIRMLGCPDEGGDRLVRLRIMNHRNTIPACLKRANNRAGSE